MKQLNILILILVFSTLGVSIAVLIKTYSLEKYTPPIYAANAGSLDTSMQGGADSLGLQKCSQSYCPTES